MRIYPYLHNFHSDYRPSALWSSPSVLGIDISLMKAVGNNGQNVEEYSLDINSVNKGLRGFNVCLLAYL